MKQALLTAKAKVAAKESLLETAVAKVGAKEKLLEEVGPTGLAKAEVALAEAKVEREEAKVELAEAKVELAEAKGNPLDITRAGKGLDLAHAGHEDAQVGLVTARTEHQRLLTGTHSLACFLHLHHPRIAIS
jgi:hypothetical protein